MSRGVKGALAALGGSGVTGMDAGLRPRFLGAGVLPLDRVAGILVWSACVSQFFLSDFPSYHGLASHQAGFACSLCSARFHCGAASVCGEQVVDVASFSTVVPL